MFENFAMMIPSFGIHNISGCLIHNATGEEFVRFEEWVKSGEIIQLKANDEALDIWINKDPHGLGRTTKTLNGWFDHWKNPPKQTYEFSEHKINL